MRTAESRAAIVFWDVDTQADFLYPYGKLYVPGAEKIIPKLERLTRWAEAHGVLVISSVCAHHPGNPEFAVYGPHCLAGTAGQQKIPQTLAVRRRVIPNSPAILPGDLAECGQLILEKDALDVFTNPNANGLVKKLGPKPRIALYGVVTEICVGYTARGLLDRGAQVWLVQDAVRALDEVKGAALVSEVEARGGRPVTTADLLAELSARD